MLSGIIHICLGYKSSAVLGEGRTTPVIGNQLVELLGISLVELESYGSIWFIRHSVPQHVVQYT